MSQLENLVKSRLNKRAGSVNRLTVRLDHERHERLKSMADAFNLSKTASAEEILATAVDDAYALYVATLDDQELYEETTSLERAVNDRYIDDHEDMQEATISARADILAQDERQQEAIQRMIANGAEVVTQ